MYDKSKQAADLLRFRRWFEYEIILFLNMQNSFASHTLVFTRELRLHQSIDDRNNLFPAPTAPHHQHIVYCIYIYAFYGPRSQFEYI